MSQCAEMMAPYLETHRHVPEFRRLSKVIGKGGTPCARMQQIVSGHTHAPALFYLKQCVCREEEMETHRSMLVWMFH